MFDASVARYFHEVEVADQVRLGIGARLLDRIAHPNLRAQMRDAVKAVVVKRSFECHMVREANLLEGEAAAPSSAPPDPP